MKFMLQHKKYCLTGKKRTNKSNKNRECQLQSTW